MAGITRTGRSAGYGFTSGGSLGASGSFSGYGRGTLGGRAEVEGLRELEQALEQLPRATGKNVLKRTGMKALEPIRDDAIGKAPKAGQSLGYATGDLAKSITIKTKLKKAAYRMQREDYPGKRLAVELFLGPTKPHGHLVEFGTLPRFREDGTSTGQAPPQPFMRPAWDAGANKALESIKQTLADEISKAAQRLARKAARRARAGR